MKKKTLFLNEAIYTALIVSSFFFDIPYFFEAIVSLWIISTIYSLFYSKDFQKEQIYLSTKNDIGTKHTQLIFGIIFLIVSSIGLYYWNEKKILLILILVQSILMITIYLSKKEIAKGLFIRIEKDKLIYDIAKIHKEIFLNEINRIDIMDDQIIIARQNEKKNYILFLEMNKEEKRKALTFFKRNLNTNIILSSK